MPRLRITQRYDIEQDFYWLTAWDGDRKIHATWSGHPPTKADRRRFAKQARRLLVQAGSATIAKTDR